MLPLSFLIRREIFNNVIFNILGYLFLPKILFSEIPIFYEIVACKRYEMVYFFSEISYTI